jgi:hypothetical protein
MAAVTDTRSAARRRADRYATLAPARAIVEITEEVFGGGTTYAVDLAQLTVRGSTETILVTLSSWPGSSRSRAKCSAWFNHDPARDWPVKVRWIGHTIRNLYV